jgi:nucleotide-binding universal stress UspA family protein
MRFDDLKLILFPTDFSEASQVAVDAAVTLAHTFRAAIESLHVDLNLALVLPPPGDVFAMPIAMEGLMARAAEQVERIVPRFAKAMSSVPGRRRWGGRTRRSLNMLFGSAQVLS